MEFNGSIRIVADVRKATAAGLADTIRDTLAWNVTRPANHEWRAGVKREREKELLEKWNYFAS